MEPEKEKPQYARVFAKIYKNQLLLSSFVFEFLLLFRMMHRILAGLAGSVPPPVPFFRKRDVVVPIGAFERGGYATPSV